MSLIEFIKETVTSPAFVILGTVTLFEVAPIRLNPWKHLFRWIGEVMTGDLRSDVSEMKRDFEQKSANDMRWNILNFANSCRRGEPHGKDEWRHVISQIAEYEEYTEAKGIVNGVINEDSCYLRELYMNRNKKNDFLK